MAQTLKVGDKVTINKDSQYYINTKMNPIGVVGTVILIIPNSSVELPYEVKWDNGYINQYASRDLDLVEQSITKQSKTETMSDIQKIKKQAVLDTANELLKANNTVTTLEIKNELRQNYPDFRWYQRNKGAVLGVSEIIDELAQGGAFTYTDNGFHRVYSKVVAPQIKSGSGYIPTIVGTLFMGTSSVVKPAAKIAKRGSKPRKPKAPKVNPEELMKGNKGRFFTAVFVKKDGETRTINCQYLKDQKSAASGHVLVREASKLKTDPKNSIRQINLNTLKSLHIDGKDFSF